MSRRVDLHCICKRMAVMKRSQLVALVVASTSVVTLAIAQVAQPHAADTCRASAVQYRAAKQTSRGVSGVPWVASTNSAFRGYLFYWGGTRWSRTHPKRVRIFTTNAHVNVHPKVLWVALRRAASAVTIRGTRLDGEGSFVAHYPAAIGGGQFPSYVSVPAEGCWRVSVRSGSLRGAVTFSATDTP
jgi:hypothetical protein